MPETSLQTFVTKITTEHHFDNDTFFRYECTRLFVFLSSIHQDMTLKNTIHIIIYAQSNIKFFTASKWEYEINNLHFRQIDDILVKLWGKLF